MSLHYLLKYSQL